MSAPSCSDVEMTRIGEQAPSRRTVAVPIDDSSHNNTIFNDDAVTADVAAVNTTNRSCNNSHDALHAYFPDVVDATGVAVVMTEHEEEEALVKRRRMFLGIGGGICVVVTFLVIIPIIVVLAPGSPSMLVMVTKAPSSVTAAPTLAPTLEPTSEALSEIVQFLRQYTANRTVYPEDNINIIDEAEAWWNQRSSPQYKAAKWLADQETTIFSEISTPRVMQRFALATFYFATNVVNHDLVEDFLEDWSQCGSSSAGCPGNLWLSFDDDADECDWGYVTCEILQPSNNQNDNTNNETGISTNTDVDVDGEELPPRQLQSRRKVVTELRFPPRGNNLQGILPPELSLLSYLRVFSVPNNRLQGGNMQEDPTTTNNGDISETMRLSPLEEAFHGLSTLEVLNLHGNGLSGRLPSNIFQQNPQMEFLFLGDNNFSGTIPSHELSALTELVELQLEHNQLGGSIPSALGALHSTLLHLELTANQLTGRVPTEMYGLTALTSLILSNNTALSIPLDDVVGQLTNLKTLVASFTQLTGTLPEELFSRGFQLETLKIESTSLQGTLSENLALWNASLHTLWLRSNQLTGALPSALDALTLLKELRLEGNSFTGTISEAVCDRRGDQFQQLAVLTVDCSIECSCCDNYNETC